MGYPTCAPCPAARRLVRLNRELGSRMKLLFNSLRGTIVAFTAGVILSPPRAIPTGALQHLLLCFQSFADGLWLALSLTDEVARNGVLQRITSARGFL